MSVRITGRCSRPAAVNARGLAAQPCAAGLLSAKAVSWSRLNARRLPMTLHLLATCLIVCIAACSGNYDGAPNVISPTRRTPTQAELVAVASKLDPARDYNAEGQAFDKLVTAGRATEAEVRAVLGVDPDRWYRWTADAGEFRAAEYDVRGLRPRSPFFEAFSHVYESPAFGVFYKRTAGSWLAVDGGFYTKGMLKPERLEPGK